MTHIPEWFVEGIYQVLITKIEFLRQDRSRTEEPVRRCRGGPTPSHMLDNEYLRHLATVIRREPIFLVPFLWQAARNPPGSPLEGFAPKPPADHRAVLWLLLNGSLRKGTGMLRSQPELNYALLNAPDPVLPQIPLAPALGYSFAGGVCHQCSKTVKRSLSRLRNERCKSLDPFFRKSCQVERRPPDAVAKCQEKLRSGCPVQSPDAVFMESLMKACGRDTSGVAISPFLYLVHARAWCRARTPVPRNDFSSVVDDYFGKLCAIAECLEYPDDSAGTPLHRFFATLTHGLATSSLLSLLRRMMPHTHQFDLGSSGATAVSDLCREKHWGRWKNRWGDLRRKRRSSFWPDGIRPKRR